jgi:SAM-dependent methyltransferase
MPVPRLVGQSYQDYYNSRFRRYGNAYQYAGWVDKEDQIRTYLAVDDLLGINQWKLAHSILDVGCGVGHYYEHLLRASAIQNVPMRKFQFAYTGIDGNLKATQAATLAYGENFLHQDLSQYNPPYQFDFVICIGLLGFDPDIMEKIKKLKWLCRGKLIFSLVKEKHDVLCAINYIEQKRLIEGIEGVNSLRTTDNMLLWSIEKSG